MKPLFIFSFLFVVYLSNAQQSQSNALVLSNTMQSNLYTNVSSTNFSQAVQINQRVSRNVYVPQQSQAINQQRPIQQRVNSNDNTSISITFSNPLVNSAVDENNMWMNQMELDNVGNEAQENNYSVENARQIKENGIENNKAIQLQSTLRSEEVVNVAITEMDLNVKEIHLGKIKLNLKAKSTTTKRKRSKHAGYHQEHSGWMVFKSKSKNKMKNSNCRSILGCPTF